MLLEILGIAALGCFYATRDDEQKANIKKAVDKTIENTNKNMDRKYSNGEISDEEYVKFKNSYNRLKNKF